MLGKPPKDKEERNFCKQTILGIVNGMGPKGLAKRLKCDERTWREYLEKFAATYPNEMAFRRLMVGQIASTGRVETFMGRDRTNTGRTAGSSPVPGSRSWSRSSDRTAIGSTFRPFQPRGRVLTCYIHRAWDAPVVRINGGRSTTLRPGESLTNRDYRFYDQTFLEFNLPIRNFAWRSIRRVRWNGEEAKYRGLDATARSLFNAICQGGTADIAKIMMLGVGPLLTKFGARLVLQIHDELVFEVPRDHVVAFIREAMSALSHPPCPGFAVPILLKPKHGTRFGALAWRDAKAIASLRPPRSAVLGLVAPVSSPGGLRGAIYRTRTCPRMRGTPRPVLSEHRWSLTSAPWWSFRRGVCIAAESSSPPWWEDRNCGHVTTSLSLMT